MSSTYLRWQYWISGLVWLYPFSMLAIVITIRLVSDLWWLSTILLFSPRWLLALPLLILTPLVIWRRKLLLVIPLITSVVLIFGPIMDLRISLKRPKPNLPKQVLRVLTYNVHEGQVDLRQLSEFINESSIDLVALQEFPQDTQFNLPKGWYLVKQRGLAVFSKYPLKFTKTIQVLQPGEQWPATHLLHAEITTSAGLINFCSIHLPSPRFGLQTVLDKRTLLRPSRKDLLEKQTKARWFAATEVQKYLSSITQPLLVVGDFNTPADSRLYQDVWGEYSNAFNKTGLGYGWTQRVSVHGLPIGARIDHVLTNNKLRPLLCSVGPDMGSDHLPVIADIDLNQ